MKRKDKKDSQKASSDACPVTDTPFYEAQFWCRKVVTYYRAPSLSPIGVSGNILMGCHPNLRFILVYSLFLKASKSKTQGLSSRISQLEDSHGK